MGVHRTLFKSCSLTLDPLRSHPETLSIASARLEAAVPMVVRSSSLRAAGVSVPSALRGVHEGGGMEPFLADPAMLLLTLEGVRNPGRPPSNSALARKLFDAELESLCESRSRADRGAIWKVAGGGIATSSAGSSDCDRIRGVASSVPHVISCFTAAGPSWEGVGEGSEGTNASVLVVGDLGRSEEL